MSSVWGNRNLRGEHGVATERIHYCFPGYPKTACGMRWKVPMDEWNLTWTKAETNCVKCKNIMGMGQQVAMYENQDNNARRLALEHKRRAAGLCSKCCKPSGGFARCTKCRIYERDLARARRAKG